MDKSSPLRDSIYLQDIPLSEAWERFLRALDNYGLWKPLEVEEIPLEDALGRVTAQAVWAIHSSPHYHAAAMDGYAIRAIETEGASDRSPITLSLGEQAYYVDTGDPMPAWADSVVPIEQVELIKEGEKDRAVHGIRLRAALAPWSHVRPMGEDMVASELVLPAGHVLGAVDLGALAGAGHSRVKVWRQPRVAVIPTGSELVQPGSKVEPGQITEFNSLVLAAQIETWGGKATRHAIVSDDFKRICAAVSQVVTKHDLVLISAGSSAGSEDYTSRVIHELGEVLVHGIAVRPGHPVILGMLDQPTAGKASTPGAIPVIGVPGYPVSAALTGEIFVEPLLAHWTGRSAPEPQIIQAKMTRKVHSSLGDDEFLRVTVGRVGDQLVAAPLARGAGVITSLVRADGLVLIPAGVQGIQAGESVDVRLYRSPSEIERTILILGSHDLTIDLMAQFLALRGARISSANLGSVGGLIALRRQEAHLAGSHLLDPETGEYNLGYIQKYMPGIPTVVVGLVYRDQGLIVPAGNPKNLENLQDITREGVRFINRQRGAGTRILLDYHLDQLGIAPEAIEGYEREEFTHLAVAASIASGRADCGLGIRAAAGALDLDFIPITRERYDLIIPKLHYASDKLAPLLALLQEPEFKAAIEALPGYDTEPMGERIASIDAD